MIRRLPVALPAVLVALVVDPACVIDAGDTGQGEGEGEGEPVEPLFVEDATWNYNDVEGAVCGNGDPVGVATNRGRSARLVLYLEGGGACWDDFTCGNGFAAFVDTGIPDSVIRNIVNLRVGIFDRQAQHNPFAADSFAYVPYCTGDVHAGTRAETPHGVAHVGANNLKIMLPRILASFPDVTEVVLAGTSAGGYGAAYNAERLRALLPAGVTMSVLMDSSAPLPVFPGAEQGAADQVTAWQPELCAGCATVNEHFDAVVSALADVRFGLIQSNGDEVLRLFFSPNGVALPVTTWDAALDAFVAERADVPNLRFFVTDATKHVYVYDADLAATVVDEVPMSDFIAGVVGDGDFVTALSP